MELEKFLTLKDAAKELGLHPATLRSQIRYGHLTTQKFGSVHAVSRAEIERYRRESLGRYAKPIETVNS